MDLAQIDPALLERIDRAVTALQWGWGVLVIAAAIRLGGENLARILSSIMGR